LKTEVRKMVKSFTRESSKETILILVSNKKTLPPLGDHHGIVDLIDHPIRLLLDQENIKVISFWDNRLKNLIYDPSIYYHADSRYKNVFSFIPYRVRKKIFRVANPEICSRYFHALQIAKKIRPTFIITHVDLKLALLAAKFLPHSKHVYYYHGSILHNNINFQQWNELETRFDGIVFITKSVVEGLKAKFGQCNIPYRVILNAIDLEWAHPEKRNALREVARRQWRIRPEEILIIYAGRLQPTKGLMPLVKGFLNAYQKNPKLRLVIAGDPARETYGNFQLVDELKKLSSHLPDYVVQYPGWLDRENLQFLYSAADISVLLSMPEEGEANSLFLMESMGFGIPCIATRVGGNPEVIEDTGILIDPLNAEQELSRALEVLSSSSIREQFGQKAAERAHSFFSYQRVADELLDFINSLRLT